MFLQIALVAEIMTTIICTFRIYGEKCRLDKKTAAMIVSSLLILEIVNFYPVERGYSFLVYIFWFIYCTAEFKSTISETLISMILCMVIVTAMQFLCLLLANTVTLLSVEEEYLRDAVINIILLAVCSLFCFTNGLHRVKKSLCKNRKFVMISLGFMGLVVLMMLWEAKQYRQIHMSYFVLAIPVMILLLYAVVKWDAAQSESKRMQERFDEIEENRENYETLLTKVRLRQHAFKNHMEAISSLHYLQKSEETFLQAEEDYCRQLLKENKYNDLLRIKNDVLAGYLCGKFQEMEDAGIEIDYRIASEVSQCQTPVYHVIEMLGILFDNAMEAVMDWTEKKIFFAVCEAEDKYEFSIRNPFSYVPYEEMEEWFRFEKSKKGSGRGLGLYHLKCLCREWNCDIGCRNMEINGKNWIGFSLSLGKKREFS